MDKIQHSSYLKNETVIFILWALTKNVLLSIHANITISRLLLNFSDLQINDKTLNSV